MTQDDEIEAALRGGAGDRLQRSVDHFAGDPHKHCNEMVAMKDAEVARLQREVDHRLDEMNLQARWTREAQAKVERLRDALRPFAEFGKAMATHPRWDESTVFAAYSPANGTPRVTVTGAHINAALKALEGT